VGGKIITALSLLRGHGDHSCMQVISIPVEISELSSAQQQHLQTARRLLHQMATRLSCF